MGYDATPTHGEGLKGHLTSSSTRLPQLPGRLLAHRRGGAHTRLQNGGPKDPKIFRHKNKHRRRKGGIAVGEKRLCVEQWREG